MGWLSKLFGPDWEGISIHETEAIKVPGVSDLSVLPRAIDIVMPHGSVFYLEGAVDDKVEAFLRAHPTERPSKVQLGTLWPRGEVFHLPIESNNIAELVHVSENLPLPEICTHLVVYQGEQVLLSAYDVGPNEDLWLNSHLPPDTINRFREALGVKQKD